MSKPIQKFARGQVWYVKDEEGDNGNFKGSVIGKTRPYLIISNNHNNLITDLVTVVPLTTSDSHFTTKNSRVIGVYKLDSSVHDKNHYILCNQIKTINNTELIEFYGQLDKHCLKEVSDLINKTLCLSEKYEELFDNSYIGTSIIDEEDECEHDINDKEALLTNANYNTSPAVHKNLIDCNISNKSTISKEDSVVSNVTVFDTKIEDELVDEEDHVNTTSEQNVEENLVDNNYVPRFTFSSKYEYEMQDEIRPLANVWSLRLYKLAKKDISILSTGEICKKYSLQKSNISSFKRKVSKETVSVLVAKKGLA